MRQKSWRFVIALIMAFIGLFMIVYFSLIKEFNDGSQQIDSKLASEYGSLIGGLAGSLFTLAGFFLLYETLIAQKVAFERQQFENKFFELLRIHRENLGEIKFKTITGRTFFIKLRNDFGIILNEINSIDKRSILTEKEKVNLGYQLIYFGSARFKAILKKRPDRYNNNQLHIVNQVINNANTLLRRGKKIYTGHQVRLGHYYRHMFQIVKFVDQIEFLSTKEKYFYTKMLRSQLSSHEQVILFFNALSDLGDSWMIGEPNLMTKYQMIKNIPPGFTFGIDPKKYFPKIRFESYVSDIGEIMDDDENIN